MLQRWKPVAMIWSCVGRGKEIAGDLLDRELVEGLVLVEGGDDPVAIGPDVAEVVEVEPVGVAYRATSIQYRARCSP
jgi:hypothetical protein